MVVPGLMVSVCVLQSISCHYASSDCSYIDVRGTTQQFLEDDIKDMIKSKLKIDDEDLEGFDMKVIKLDACLCILLIIGT